jgi:DNA-directed RNA polymerase subunit RPC12/RpoP
MQENLNSNTSPIINAGISSVSPDLNTDRNEAANQNISPGINPDINSMNSAEIIPDNINDEIDKAVKMKEIFNKLFSTVLQQGVDFDKIPGTDKPTLLKPGADLLCQIFHFSSGEPKILSFLEDFEKGILSYTVSIPIVHRDTGTIMGVGIGGSNSFEVRYKYRYIDSDEGERVRVENPEPADQQNTLIKMASKRAYIDGVLKATGASRMFTQDIEDMPWLQPEKASVKQLNYIRALYKDTPENSMIEDVSGIVDRQIDNLEDIYRNEASKVIEIRKKAGKSTDASVQSQPRAHKSKNERYVCSNCGTRITQGVAAYSLNRYKRELCENCQRESGPLQ